MKNLRTSRALLARLGLALCLCACAWRGAARAEVILSEIMYNPDHADTGAGFNKEWVELFNNGASRVDLGGWVFEDIQDGNAAAPIPSGTVLAPNQALVLVGDSTTFDDQWGAGLNRIQLDNFPTLANSPSSSNEILGITNQFGVLQDVVNYDDENGWPTDVSDGPSIYVLPNFLTSADNDVGSHWQSSTPLIDGAYYNLASPFGEKASPGFVATEQTIFPPFEPSPDAAWSMAVFPDTQNYVKTQAHLPVLDEMVDWVSENRDAWNIQLVLQEGDIVNTNANENPSSGENPATLQWQNAHAAMSQLNGIVPYIMAVGNHDTGISGSQNGPTRFNEFFSITDNPLVDPAQGGILKGVMEPGHLENAYFELTAPDGRQLLITSLAWDPGPQEISWANRVISRSEYDDHTAMLLMHSYLRSNGSRSNDGETVWNNLVKLHGNSEIVFNGHVGGDGTGYLVSTGNSGNQVDQMVFNTQFEGNGGNGWIRVLEFLEDGRTVRVRTYSPTFGYLRTDAANQFTFEVTPLNPADFDGDGDVDGDDLTVWTAGFGLTDANWTDGDADGDGLADGADFLQWQRGITPGVAGAAQAPEPATMLLLLAIILFSPQRTLRRQFRRISPR